MAWRVSMCFYRVPSVRPLAHGSHARRRMMRHTTIAIVAIIGVLTAESAVGTPSC